MRERAKGCTVPYLGIFGFFSKNKLIISLLAKAQCTNTVSIHFIIEKVARFKPMLMKMGPAIPLACIVGSISHQASAYDQQKGQPTCLFIKRQLVNDIL